jgi:hypothetical protein
VPRLQPLNDACVRLAQALLKCAEEEEVSADRRGGAAQASTEDLQALVLALATEFHRCSGCRVC